MFKDINPTLGEIVIYLSSHLFAQIQIDVPDWPTGMRVLVVLQNVRLSAQSTASQHKPAPLPGLDRVKDLLLKKVFMCKNNLRTRCKHSTPVCQLLRSFWDFYFGLWTSVFFLSELLIIWSFFFSVLLPLHKLIKRNSVVFLHVLSFTLQWIWMLTKHHTHAYVHWTAKCLTLVSGRLASGVGHYR